MWISCHRITEINKDWQINQWGNNCGSLVECIPSLLPPNQPNSPTRHSRLSLPYGSALFSSEYISLHEHSLCQVCRANIPSVVLLLAHYVTIILIHILPLSRTPAFVWKTSTSPLQPIWRVYWEMQYCLGECRIGVCRTRRCMIAFFLSPKPAQQTEYRYNRRVAVCQSKQPLRWILRMFPTRTFARLVACTVMIFFPGESWQLRTR